MPPWGVGEIVYSGRYRRPAGSSEIESTAEILDGIFYIRMIVWGICFCHYLKSNGSRHGRRVWQYEIRLEAVAKSTVAISKPTEFPEHPGLRLAKKKKLDSRSLERSAMFANEPQRFRRQSLEISVHEIPSASQPGRFHCCEPGMCHAAQTGPPWEFVNLLLLFGRLGLQK